MLVEDKEELSTGHWGYTAGGKDFGFLVPVCSQAGSYRARLLQYTVASNTPQ